MVLPVLSQRTYPSAGDIDDCWVVATVWAAASSRPTIVRPTTTTFRRYAGVPDQPGPTGGNIWDCEQGADGCWPTLPNELVITRDWNAIVTRLQAGRPASVALDSLKLPARLRYNFYGKHQVAVDYEGGRLYCMNPLAPENTKPLSILFTELRYAMVNLIPGTTLPYRAVFFPKPAAGPLWGWDVDDAIQRAYSASSVASKLRAVGVSTWGSRINEVDLEAGLRARRIGFGTSVQLIDVKALMRPGTGPT